MPTYSHLRPLKTPEKAKKCSFMAPGNSKKASPDFRVLIKPKRCHFRPLKKPNCSRDSLCFTKESFLGNHTETKHGKQLAKKKVGSRYKVVLLPHWVSGAGAQKYIIQLKLFFLSKQSLDSLIRHLCALPGSPR